MSDTLGKTLATAPPTGAIFLVSEAPLTPPPPLAPALGKDQLKEDVLSLWIS